MNDIIKIIKSLEDSGVVIDGVTETVKHKIKKQEGRFPGALITPFNCLNSVTSDFFSGKRHK